MATPNIKISDLDFAQIKENFKTFLKSQSQFNDYNVEGSGLSILLDILAANTAYQSFYLNMALSEMFLDSAVLRRNVVGRAKHLGYTPRSAKSAKAKVNLTIDPSFGPGDTSPSEILIPSTQEFSSNIDNKLYYFTPTKSVLITPVNGVYSASDVEIVEGKRLTHKWTVDTSSPLKQKFIIPNKNIDTDFLTIKVQDSATSSVVKFFSRNEDITEINSDSQVYFIQEAEDQKYEIYFGDGFVGKGLVDGNIIIAEYIVSSGSVVNGAKSFSAVNKLAGYNIYSVTTSQVAGDSSEAESIESIKLLAPLNYESQNRAVTEGDYETLLKKDVPSLQFVRVWGGEENNPPDYGKVYIAVKPYTGLSLSVDQKNDLINNHIKPRSIIAIEPVIVEPEYLFVKIRSTVYYNSRETTSNASTIANIVKNSILSFVNSELNGFDSDFRYSKLLDTIDNSEGSIKNNLTDITLKYRFYPPVNVPTKFTININNAISTGDATNSISGIDSSAFIYRGISTKIGDDGKGNVYLYREVAGQKVVIRNDLGFVDYATGEIILNSLDVQGFSDSLDYIDLFILPKRNDVTALREQILLVESDDIEITVSDVSKK